MKKSIVDDALKQSEIILHEVEAIRKYVRSVVRPKAYELTNDDEFIIELMSTTYVSLQIMNIFKQEMDDYAYRRVSLNPRNDDNRADSHEEEMAEWFDSDRERTFWQGVVKKGSGTYFTSMIPDYISNECLYCHGDPNDAPPELIKRYGDKKGFQFKEGDLAGVNSVSIPITDSLNRLYGMTIMNLVAFLCASLLLLIILNYLFDKLIVSKLTKVIATVERKQGERKVAQHESVKQSDELDTLRESVNHLACYVQTAQKGNKQLPSFIGPYIVEEPIVAGTLSWLYRGSHSQSGEKVLLKIPFDSLVDNPIYRTFYKVELKMLRNCDNSAVLNFSEVIGNVLISKGPNKYQPLIEQVDSLNRPKEFFLNIFKLVAYLHTRGMVHHNFIPEMFVVADDGRPLLVDHGLTWWSQISDDLHHANLGPQGTQPYIAPEQLAGIRGDSRSDIYSLGIWLYFYFTGTIPLQDEQLTKAQLLKEKKRQTFLIDLEKYVDRNVVRVLKKALEPEPEKRYQWVEDLRDDILPYISDGQPARKS